jgi:hypothetical protein
MFVVVQHAIKDPEVAFTRGQRLMVNDGAPEGTEVMQFLPSEDGTAVTCLWTSDSVGSVQQYVDDVLGSSSDNFCYPVDVEHAFAAAPKGLGLPPVTVAA